MWWSIAMYFDIELLSTFRGLKGHYTFTLWRHFLIIIDCTKIVPGDSWLTVKWSSALSITTVFKDLNSTNTWVNILVVLVSSCIFGNILTRGYPDKPINAHLNSKISPNLKYRKQSFAGSVNKNILINKVELYLI